MKWIAFDYIPNQKAESIYRQHLPMMIHVSNIHTQIYMKHIEMFIRRLILLKKGCSFIFLTSIKPIVMNIIWDDQHARMYITKMDPRELNHLMIDLSPNTHTPDLVFFQLTYSHENRTAQPNWTTPKIFPYEKKTCSYWSLLTAKRKSISSWAKKSKYRGISFYSTSF